MLFMSKLGKIYIYVIVLFTFLGSIIIGAQEEIPDRKLIIGIIYNSNIKPFETIAQNFTQKSMQSGHLIKKIKFTKGKVNRMVKAIEESPCSYVISIGLQPSLASLQANMPGIFCMVPNPVKHGFLDKDGKPLSPLTGILMNITPELLLKLTSLMPTHNQIGLMHNSKFPEFIIQNYKKHYTDAGYGFFTKTADQNTEVLPALEELKSKIDLAISVVDNIVYNKNTIPLISRFSYTNKIPFIGYSKRHLKQGAILSFYPDYQKFGAELATFLETVIKHGETTTPVKFYTSIKYDINMQTAKIMKINLDELIVNGAANVINK